MLNGLPVVTAGLHGAAAHGVAEVVGGAVGGLIEGKIRGGFAGLNITQPLDGVVVEALAALVAHILGQTVDHKPQGDINGTLHKHSVTAAAGGREGAVDVVAVSEIGADLLKCGCFGSGAHLTILGNDAELVLVAHGAVVVYCQEHGRELLKGGNATNIACCWIFSGVTPTRRR